MNDVGVNVQGMRKLLRKGMTKERLIREIGCSRPALDRWLNGIAPRSPLMIGEINRAVTRLLNRAEA